MMWDISGKFYVYTACNKYYLCNKYVHNMYMKDVSRKFWTFLKTSHMKEKLVHIRQEYVVQMKCTQARNQGESS